MPRGGKRTRPSTKLIQIPRICACSDHAFVSLTKGYLAIFDVLDIPIITRSDNWWALVKDKTVYAMRTHHLGNKKKKNIRMHRDILGLNDELQTDHRDGCGLNNRRRNLRPATHAQNQQNSTAQRGSSSIYKGVAWDAERQKWDACIQANLVGVVLGQFDSEVAAALAYDHAALQYHGEFARLNFPKRTPAAA